jgi:hypothetical protein
MSKTYTAVFKGCEVLLKLISTAVFNNNKLLKFRFSQPFFKHEAVIDFPLRGKILGLLRSMYLEVLEFFK